MAQVTQQCQYMTAEISVTTFHVGNASKRDAEGIERLQLRISVDVVVSCRQHGSPALMLLTRRLLNKQPSHFRAPFAPVTDFTDGNPRAGVLAPWKRPCRLL